MSRRSNRDLVLDACGVARPDASVVETTSGLLAVWRVEYDALVDPESKVPTNAKWRAQLVSTISGSEVWWNGYESQAATRKAAIEGALAYS